MMNSDAARSDAFTKYCIASNMSRDEVSQAAAVFASAWDAGAEYGAERAETERDAALGDAAECRAERSRYGDMMTDKLVATEAERDAARAEVARLQEAARALYETFYVDDDGGAFVYWITKPKYAETFAAAFGIDTD